MNQNFSHQEILRFGSGTTVYIDNQPLQLTRSEYQVFHYLAENVNEVCSKDSISKEVWGAGAAELNDSRLTAIIYRIRKHLIKIPSDLISLDSIRNAGYVLRVTDETKIIEKTEARSAGYWPGLRSEIVDRLSQWVTAGKNVTVSGLPGSGKSHLLNYISRYPEEVVGNRKPVSFIFVRLDLNNLVDHQPLSMYRLILRACYHLRSRFSDSTITLVEDLYTEYAKNSDPFIAQTAVYDLLAAFEQSDQRLVIILDQFDRLLKVSAASLELMVALRGLHDSFRGTLSYIVVIRQTPAHLEVDRLGDLYPLLDTHVCWVGAMAQPDAQMFVSHELIQANKQAQPEEIDALINATGSYPSLLKAACAWWTTTPIHPPLYMWDALLVKLPTIQHRLTAIWSELSQEERWILAQLPNGAGPLSTDVLRTLSYRGLCDRTDSGWEIRGSLLRDFIYSTAKSSRGRISKDERTGGLYQGGQKIEGLRPLEEALLSFLVQHPYMIHTKTALIQAVWPEGTQIEGVTDDSLYQIVRGIRQRIEPSTAESPVYLVTRRGVEEGGYQFFPEGRP